MPVQMTAPTAARARPAITKSFPGSFTPIISRRRPAASSGFHPGQKNSGATWIAPDEGRLKQAGSVPHLDVVPGDLGRCVEAAVQPVLEVERPAFAAAAAPLFRAVDVDRE